MFSIVEGNVNTILWNNKETRVDNKPVFYKKNCLKKMSFS